MILRVCKVSAFLVSLAAVGFAAFWFSRPSDIRFEDHRASLPFADSSRFAVIDGVRIHYLDIGEGDPLVLVHGLASSSLSWKSVIAPLAKRNRLIVPDLKGFGFSDKPDGDYSRAEQARIVLRLLDELGIESAHFGGNSMGGETVANIALQHPDRVRSLTLIDSGGTSVVGSKSISPFYLRIPYLNRALMALAATSKGVVRSGLENSYFDDSKITDETVEHYHRPLQGDHGQRAALLARSQSVPGELEGKLGLIKVPVTVIWGANDEIFPVEAAHRIHSLIPGSRLVVIENCGHLPQEEAPERTVAEILKAIGQPV